MEILARAVGRRKEAVAQVQIVRGNGQFTINNKSAIDYLHNNSCSLLSIKAPFEVLQNVDSQPNESSFTYDNLDTIVKVKGGGLMGQADAIKLAVARALCDLQISPTHTNENSLENEVRKNLKTKGYLTQDSRVKERRKYGLKKARKASQYHKR
uniref:ribosomal protein S9 n=1 Tax=Chlamydomonas chlamydogama TaxID=225041 RepID=UPI00226D2F89|nr:ribosomal protein S9 [Chlamydomonas chlamydogama]UZA61947.1 ribosomal protein S9 [Chlamydomonas chlamydogama]